MPDTNYHNNPASCMVSCTLSCTLRTYVHICASLAYARVLRTHEKIFLDKILILRKYPNLC